MTIEQTPQEQQQPQWWKLLKKGGYLSRRPRPGEVLKATILSIKDQDILVELQGKRDGVIQRRDLDMVSEDYLEQLQVGEQIPVRVLRGANEGGVIVSLKQGLEQKDWLKAQEMLDTNNLAEVEVIDSNRGGVVTTFGRLRGFVPNSHLTSIPRGMRGKQRNERKENLIGETLKVVVIEVNQRRRRLILSERAAQAQRRQEVLAELHEGAIRTGVVRNLVSFGAFVDLGGVDGLIHVSELDWKYVKHPNEILNVGDEVEVYVLAVDRERERISLSRKRLIPDPWQQVTANLSRGDEVEGKVTEVKEFGAFVNIGNNIEGLIYNSEMSEADRAQLITDTPVTVKILDIDPLEQKIALRLQEFEPLTAEAETEEAETEEIEVEAEETEVEAEPEAEPTDEAEPEESETT